MEKNFVYLTYYQAMAFLLEIDEIRKKNPNFKDSISSAYGEYVVERTTEIATTYSTFKLKIFPKATKYKVAKSLFEYLTRLTSIDVFNQETMELYTKIIMETEEQIYNDLQEEFKESEVVIKKRIL